MVPVSMLYQNQNSNTDPSPNLSKTMLIGHSIIPSEHPLRKNLLWQLTPPIRQWVTSLCRLKTFAEPIRWAKPKAECQSPDLDRSWTRLRSQTLRKILRNRRKINKPITLWLAYLIVVAHANDVWRNNLHHSEIIATFILHTLTALMY